MDDRKLRQTDEAGTLVQAGFSWTEPRLNLHWWYAAVVDALFSVGGGLAPIAFFLAISENRLWVVAAIACAFALSIAAAAHLKIVTEPLRVVQALIFDADGPMDMAVTRYYRKLDAHGRFYPEWKELRWTIDEISSIEIVSELNMGGGHFMAAPYCEYEYPSYSVTIYFISGETYRAARNLRQDEARVVAVQLNRALAEVRSAQPAPLQAEVA